MINIKTPRNQKIFNQNHKVTVEIQHMLNTSLNDKDHHSQATDTKIQRPATKGSGS